MQGNAVARLKPTASKARPESYFDAPSSARNRTRRFHVRTEDWIETAYFQWVRGGCEGAAGYWMAVQFFAEMNDVNQRRDGMESTGCDAGYNRADGGQACRFFAI
jgi:hypothetical protein